MKPKEKTQRVLQILRDERPDAKYELDWDTPEHLLVATILAAQCTDERVNRVTKTLFPKYPDPESFVAADLATLEEDVKPTGTYKQKAKAIKGAMQGLVDRFDSKVPTEIEKLITLPGVARKTANVVLNTAFNIPSGVIVDTHVARTSQRIGLTEQEKAEKIEVDLMELVPKEDWTFFGPALVLHGRYVCTAKDPQCSSCSMAEFCAKNGV